VAGQRDEALASLKELTRAGTESYVSPARIAQVHLGLGDRARALDWIERALSVHATELAWLGVQPMFDALRGESRFQAVLERIDLTDTNGATRAALSVPQPPISASPPP
jgi:hypothetical protein